jgi:hypothetical protein
MMSSRPNSSTAVCTRAAAASWSATLAPLATALPPAALISSATCCAGARVGAQALGVTAEVVDDDGGAVFGEKAGDGRADAATGTGDDGDPSCEWGHPRTP